jgi:glucan 1,3-beta-glucosidase
MGDTAAPTAPFDPPSRPFISTRDSVVSGSDSIDYSGSVTPNLGGSGALIPLNPSAGDAPDVHETTKPSAQSEKPRRGVRSRLGLVSLVGAILAIAAIVLGVYFGLKHSKSKNAATAGESGSPSGTPGGSVLFGDGTVVTTDTGASFTYRNNFGGYFVKDPSNPLNNDARAQSWSPPLNQSWQWGKDQVFG